MLVRFDPFRELNRVRPSIPMDVSRQENQVVVSFDLPGVDPASIDVTVENDTLTVKAHRSWSREEGDKVLVRERGHGTFARRLYLGDHFDGNRTAAHYDNGVLTVTVPVAESATARKVEVTTGPQPEAIGSDSAAA